MPVDEIALFETWAPPEVAWSLWTKPVLFAAMAKAIIPEAPVAAIDPARLHYIPPADGQHALIVELPGTESIGMAVALAERGYRPVPLFNTTPGQATVVEVAPIMNGLMRGAELLRSRSLPMEAPPAFLLDSKRLAPGQPRKPGDYDNRWVVFPQDFPSAEMLQSKGIIGVVVVQSDGKPPQDDLREVLIRYQRSNLPVLSLDLSANRSAEPIELPRRRPWRWLRALVLVGLGLHANSAGGFGSIIPTPSAG
jgi:hypothetical protein